MASMGDDQEENIEMWKIKKVRKVFVFFSLSLSLSLGKKRCCCSTMMMMCFCDESPEMMWSLFVLSLSLVRDVLS